MLAMTEEINQGDPPSIELVHSGDGKPSFLRFLAEQQNGEFAPECGKELLELTESIENHFAEFHGKVSGTLTVEVKLTLDRGEYKVNCSVKSKRPAAPPTQTTMWLGAGGVLQRSNPAQMNMFGGTRPRSA